MSQSAKKTGDFSEEIEVLEGKIGVEKLEVPPSEARGDAFPALDFDTAIEHLERDNYDVVPGPNGPVKDVHAEKNGKKFHLAIHPDDRAEITFMIDTDTEEKFETVYSQELGEMMERERKIHRATHNYLDNFVEEAEDPVEKLEQDFQYSGGSAQEIVTNYFESMRPTDLFMNYATQFEIHPSQDTSMDRRDMPGQIPLSDALDEESKRQRNSHYIKRFMKNVLDEAENRYGLSDELRSYWMELDD